MKRKIFVVGCAGVPARYGGFETFAENLSIRISNDFEIIVFCSKSFYLKTERSKYWNSVYRIFLPLNPNGIQSLFYDIISLLKAKNKADRIIVLGSGIGLFLPLLTKSNRRKIWLHIDGMEWRRNKWNFIAKKYLYLSFTLGIRFSEKIIIDNICMAKFIPRQFHTKIVCLGYGGEHLPKVTKSISPMENPYALVIARAEPENNLELICKCFTEINILHLVVIANWDQTSLGLHLKRKYFNHPAISLFGPVFNDPVKLQAYRTHCQIYIHGHSTGGTNPSLIEAMYSEVPIFAFDNDFNRNTTNNLAYYFKNEKELRDLILNPDNLDLSGSARRLRQYALQFHTWDRTVEIFKQTI